MNRSTKLQTFRTLATLFAVGLLLTGCIVPRTEFRAAELRGRVIDAETHLPVSGAKVYFCVPPGEAVHTDANGYFLMKAAKATYWISGAGGSVYPIRKSNAIYISKKGYITHQFWRRYDGDPMNILIKPNP